jgi:hypothetical protein
MSDEILLSVSFLKSGKCYAFVASRRDTSVTTKQNTDGTLSLNIQTVIRPPRLPVSNLLSDQIANAKPSTP